ncbi:di-heme oxidoredictase family protein [Catenovulum maritimum]|uniref:di-heme oxidoredictase family protein n=1 Tax=Catenovulum maritimum TaxID=1513271 RepID=UPI00065FE279|nr:di-heme oxidoredictase family protein [Catenovulum maritimum]
MKIKVRSYLACSIFAAVGLLGCQDATIELEEPNQPTPPEIDTTPPEIRLVGEPTINLFVGDSYNEQGVIATDNLDDNLSVITTGEVNTSQQGSYIVSYSVVDSSGNSASISRNIFIHPILSTTPSEILVEAESYQAYHDSDIGNLGGQFTNDDVDIEATTDTGGGFNLGWTVRDEWLEYQIEASSATYVLDARVASEVSSGKFDIFVDDQKFATLSVNSTSGWQNFTTIESSETGFITQGTHTVRLSVVSGDFNLNWFKFRSVADADLDGIVDNNDACPFTPFDTDVNEKGCPDSDGDKVYDDTDLCSDTPSGDYVDVTGCTAVKPLNEVSFNNNILVGGSDTDLAGFTLYTFDLDSISGKSQCYDNCAENWPPVIVTDGNASGVVGLTSITRDDGSLQAVYKDQPLYFYAGDQNPGDMFGDGVADVWHTVEVGIVGDFAALYSEATPLLPNQSFIRDDGVAITRIADRGRDRHAKDITSSDHYDHFLAHYWQYRTARIQLEDYTSIGQSLIKATWITEAELGAREFRVWYSGLTTTGQFNFNPQKDEEKASQAETGVVYEGRGTWNENFEKVSDEGHQFKYTLDIVDEWEQGRPIGPLTTGRRMEFEVSMFLLAPPAGTRLNYYGTTFLYLTGQPGVHPFEWDRSEFDDSYPIGEKGLSGGGTTLGYNYSDEPAGRFMGMATNMSPEHAQPWVEGRRVHHTNFETGEHDERDENIIWTEQIGKAGNHYINHSCVSCHVRNGRALVSDVGEALDKWVFKIGDENGAPDPFKGRVLQPEIALGTIGTSEGKVTLGEWTHLDNGLRKPNYEFTNGTPVQFSARIAPQLVGLGLLEAIPESSILEWADPSDNNSDGISGRTATVVDPVTGQTRLGRFGYKAGTASVNHQVAAALNTDMGVMTSVLPEPDCGSQQTDCDDAIAELSDENLNKLVDYIRLLGVPARRDYTTTHGENIFSQIGCVDCHRASYVTSAYHPLAELRSQTIYPYTDMLLHDLGEGLADNLAEGSASGAEWRTAPLWGLGHAADVMVRDDKANDSVSLSQSADDINRVGYLHDGRARTIEEAILWHGGEAQASTDAYKALNDIQKQQLLEFLNSL